MKTDVLGLKRRRRSVSLAGGDLVRTRPLLADGELPLLAEPVDAGVDLAGWARGHRAQIESWLRRHGGVLFRGFDLGDSADFQRAATAISENLLDYRERSSPRSQVAANIYTSTDYPPSHPIFLHNENSYQAAWPMKLFFFCEIEPGEGGETPLADCRKIIADIPADIRRRFAERGVMYQRNFSERLGLPWQVVFGADDPQKVEAHCRKSGLEPEWLDGGRLRTRAARPLVDRHPRTGEPTWFNHAVFFNVATLEPEMRGALEGELALEDMPTHTYYGDGSPIEPETIALLQDLYRRHRIAFPWRRGDLLLLDNMLAAHGRAPFQGDRKILVAMAEPIAVEDALAKARAFRE